MGEYIGLVPPAEGFVQTPQFNFGPYAERPSYVKVNDDLIEIVLNMLQGQDITGVDVAMGHGMVPRRASIKLAGTNRRLYMVGVDNDQYATDRAKAEIPDTANARFTFLQGDARYLQTLLRGYVTPGKVDWSSEHDAAHEMRDNQLKAEVFNSQAAILRPGGLLSFNSAFTTEAVGTEWAVWQIEFMKTFKAHKYRGEDVQRLPVYPSLFYRRLIEDTGLIVVHEGMVSVPFYEDDLGAISEYPPFADGFTQMMVFPRPVELAEGIDEMKKAIKPALARLKTDHISRQWYEVIAQKPA